MRRVCDACRAPIDVDLNQKHPYGLRVCSETCRDWWWRRLATRRLIGESIVWSSGIRVATIEQAPTTNTAPITTLPPSSAP